MGEQHEAAIARSQQQQDAGPSGAARYRTVRVLGRGAFGEASERGRWRRAARSARRQKRSHAVRYATSAHPVLAPKTQVLLARDARTGDDVAIKRVFVPDPRSGLPPSLAREIGALRRVRHPHVVRLVDTFAVVSEEEEERSLAV